MTTTTNVRLALALATAAVCASTMVAGSASAKPGMFRPTHGSHGFHSPTPPPRVISCGIGRGCTLTPTNPTFGGGRFPGHGPVIFPGRNPSQWGHWRYRSEWKHYSWRFPRFYAGEYLVEDCLAPYQLRFVRTGFGLKRVLRKVCEVI
jgi:hypothetical protein